MSEIYLGRIVVIARNNAGSLVAGYRVSSRSFPNRMAVIAGDGTRVSIVPKQGHEADVMKNPYIAYNCARIVGRNAIVTNGSQTDPIAEKIASGMCARDALVYSLAVMDYEKDSYNTPRIAAIVRRDDERGWLGIVREDGLDVRAFNLTAGQCFHLSTYEHDVPGEQYRAEFDARDATGACEVLLGRGVFAGFTNPVTAVALMEAGTGFEAACLDK